MSQTPSLDALLCHTNAPVEMTPEQERTIGALVAAASVGFDVEGCQQGVISVLNQTGCILVHNYDCLADWSPTHFRRLSDLPTNEAYAMIRPAWMDIVDRPFVIPPHEPAAEPYPYNFLGYSFWRHHQSHESRINTETTPCTTTTDPTVSHPGAPPSPTSPASASEPRE